MALIRNIAFSKVIKIQYRQFEFNFRKHPGTAIFNVDVTDRNGQRLHFTIEKDNDNNWITRAAFLPDWIELHADLIGQHIEKELVIVEI